MANKNLFKTISGALLPKTDSLNEAHAPAYAFSPKHALAQYACTGCLNGTFYASAEEQLSKVLELAGQVDAAFVARTAVWCRERGFMKDVPALLAASLSVLEPDLLVKVFPRVIDDGRMLRNFVQILRSGQSGRKSLGSRPKRLVRQWLEARTDEALFRDSVGQNPSMADVVKMVHPKPGNDSRRALYGYLIGKPFDEKALPLLVAGYEAFKAGQSPEVPQVPFQMLTSLDLDTKAWSAIAAQAGWQMTRMNLNTFARHGVFEDQTMVRRVADRLRDPALVRKAKIFPYQLFSAWRAAGEQVPSEVRGALQDAMELAITNVPAVEGRVYVCPDVSGSMSSPVTGIRKGSSTALRCIDVAALMAAAVMRKNPDAKVLPFEHDVVRLTLNPRDSVMTNAEKLAAIGGGGTNCSAPLRLLNEQKAKGDLVIFVSDNESWVDAQPCRGSATMEEWNRFRQRNPAARLVCIDLQPYGTTQAAERDDVLNVGGFSDHVFDVVAEFASGRLEADHWVELIEQVVL